MRGGEWNVFLGGSVRLVDVLLLAQEGTPLLSRIHKDDRQQSSHRCNKKQFHAPRIARSQRSVLYSDFASAQQKCNDYLWDRNGEEKGATLPFDTLRPDFPAMCFDDVFGNGQSQPGSAASPGFIDPIEALENTGNLLSRDADACIPHSKADSAGHRFPQKKDFASRTGELDRVMDQVDQHLFQPLRVALHLRQVHWTFDA